MPRTILASYRQTKAAALTGRHVVQWPDGRLTLPCPPEADADDPPPEIQPSDLKPDDILLVVAFREMPIKNPVKHETEESPAPPAKAPEKIAPEPPEAQQPAS